MADGAIAPPKPDGMGCHPAAPLAETTVANPGQTARTSLRVARRILEGPDRTQIFSQGRTGGREDREVCWAPSLADHCADPFAPYKRSALLQRELAKREPPRGQPTLEGKITIHD